MIIENHVQLILIKHLICQDQRSMYLIFGYVCLIWWMEKNVERIHYSPDVAHKCVWCIFVHCTHFQVPGASIVFHRNLIQISAQYIGEGSFIFPNCLHHSWIHLHCTYFWSEQRATIFLASGCLVAINYPWISKQ